MARRGRVRMAAHVVLGTGLSLVAAHPAAAALLLFFLGSRPRLRRVEPAPEPQRDALAQPALARDGTLSMRELLLGARELDLIVRDAPHVVVAGHVVGREEEPLLDDEAAFPAGQHAAQLLSVGAADHHPFAHLIPVDHGNLVQSFVTALRSSATSRATPIVEHERHARGAPRPAGCRVRHSSRQRTGRDRGLMGSLARPLRAPARSYPARQPPPAPSRARGAPWHSVPRTGGGAGADRRSRCGAVADTNARARTRASPRRRARAGTPVPPACRASRPRPRLPCRWTSCSRRSGRGEPPAPRTASGSPRCGPAPDRPPPRPSWSRSRSRPPTGTRSSGSSQGKSS